MSLYLKAFIQTLIQIDTEVSEKIQFEFCIYMIIGQGQEMTLTFNTHISSHIQLDVCSYLHSGHWLKPLIVYVQDNNTDIKSWST